MKIFQQHSQMLGLILSLGALLQSCTVIHQPDETLMLSGSTTIAPLMSEIAERFESSHPGVSIEVLAGGSNKGIEDLRSGQSDIGMISRLPNDDESDLSVHTIAQDGISIVVNQSIEIEALSREQVVEIFTGRITNWQTISGQDVPIDVLSKSARHATVGLFADYFDLSVKNIQANYSFSDNTQMLYTLVQKPGAIGYVSIGAGEYQIVHGMPLQLLPIEGVSATIQQVSAGSFPLSRPLNLVTEDVPDGLEREFIEFSQSSAVHDIIERQAFVPANY